MLAYDKHKANYKRPAKQCRIADDENAITRVQAVNAESNPKNLMFAMSWQKKANQLVTKVIVDAALQLRLVEKPAFKAIVNEQSKMSVPVHCLSRKTLADNNYFIC